MFKLEPNPTFKATVQVTVPGGDSQPLPVVFKHMTAKKFAEFLSTAAEKTNAELVAAMVEEVPGIDKPQADFFEELFDNYPASTADLFRTYKRELVESRVKN